MPNLRITNLNRFESELKVGMENMSANIFKELTKDAEKLFGGVAKQIESSAEFKDLNSGEKIRGQLGLASESNKLGSDTDAKDLITLVNAFKIDVIVTKGTKRFTVRYPTLDELERNLTHAWTRITPTGVDIGPRVSWFRWWEFGDRGEVSSLTLTAANISKAVKIKINQKRSVASKEKLLDLIIDRSRSGLAIQLTRLPPDAGSHIIGRNRVQQTYSNFLKIFPARMGKVLKSLIARNGGVANNLFTRV
jgi:hypothetical protein